MQTAPSSPVEANSARTQLGMVYIAGLGVVGTALVAVTYVWEWGFCGYGIAGFFLFMAGLGFFRTAAYGGAWTAACPGCGARISSDEHPAPLRAAKVVSCPSCKAWWGGTDRLEPLAQDYVHKDPIFEARVRDEIRWPEGCARCGAPVTRTIGITPTSDGEQLAGMLGVVSLGGSSLQVPVCSRHGQTPVSMRQDGRALVVSFRSYPIYRRFCALNAGAEPSTATPQPEDPP